MPDTTPARSVGRRQEDAHRDLLEAQLRKFLAYAVDYPPHLFSPGARVLIAESRPVVEQLDALRLRPPSKNHRHSKK